ncbi:MAG: nucleotidyltransferase family protein [Acidobacteria bacterium]|nr:nucleotidyltransferase family protein [Acidobacteriota bacterium]
MNADPDTGIIVLAAGASRRMKKPKQLLRFEGRTLLRRAVETALETGFRPAIVVLGANFESLRPEIADLRVETLFNRDWETGLSSSIRAGLDHLLETAPETAAVVLTLADQPFVNAAHLVSLAATHRRTRKPIVAARYNGGLGVPALFAREVFDELRALTGDRGAKAVIEHDRERVAVVDLPEAARDIDTPADFAGLF